MVHKITTCPTCSQEMGATAEVERLKAQLDEANRRLEEIVRYKDCKIVWYEYGQKEETNLDEIGRFSLLPIEPVPGDWKPTTGGEGE